LRDRRGGLHKDSLLVRERPDYAALDPKTLDGAPRETRLPKGDRPAYPQNGRCRLDGSGLSVVDPHRGRFRTFLLAALNHFLANEWHRARCQKRGGARELISWDQRTAEDRYIAESVDELTPERIFQQRWVEALLERVLHQLREEYVVTGMLDFFEVVKEQLWGSKTGIPQGRLAANLGLSEGAMKVAMHRLRRRYRELLRFEIAQTVGSAEEIEAELRELMAALRG
jgi:DNA-directed RNA polymerase specialized sigma24 family protein